MSSASFRRVPAFPVGLVGRADVLAAVAGTDPGPGDDVGQRRAAAVALVDLVDGQPRLAVLLGLPFEDPLASVGAQVVPLALVDAGAVREAGRVTRLRER